MLCAPAYSRPWGRIVLLIGLTGSIATGKTTVLEAFAGLGIPTYSADAAVHALYEGEAAPLIETLFPGTVENGIVNRAALSAHLAAEPHRIPELEAVVHPLVYDKATAFSEKAEAEGADMAVLEVPLLFENGVRYPMDVIVVTHCAPDLQRARALARPGMTQDKFDLILSRQMPQAEKLARADYAIDTSTTIEATRAQVAALVETLRARGESTGK